MSHQKLGSNLLNKVLLKSFFSRKSFIKTYAFNYIFLKENFFQTQKTNFQHGKRTLKVQKCQILRPSRYLCLTNIKILLKYNIFIHKILSYFGWHTFEFKSQNCSTLDSKKYISVVTWWPFLQYQKMVKVC